MICVTYTLCFAIISFIQANIIVDSDEYKNNVKAGINTKVCNVITGIMVFDEFLWFFGRSASYFIWLYPIIYIFWRQHKEAKRA